MVIKNKDGSVYKISGPNPLMDDQNLWKNYEKHNFDWSPEIIKDETFKIIKEEESIKEIQVQTKKENEKEEKQESLVKNNNIEKYNPISCFCLPAENLEKKDELYDEFYKRTKYSEKIIIDIVIIEKEDLYIKIWCNELLTQGSILYPRNKDKRWWKILERSNAPVGHYYVANTSDYTPSFE